MFSINKIVLFLIISNFFIEASFGLLAPIFSVFIVRDIVGGTLAVAGFAAAVYWITKSVLQMFVGKFLDKIPGEADEILALVIGNLIMGVSAFFYLLASTPLHIYIIQFVIAIGGALAVPSWYTMFSRHIDRINESFEWSLNSSISTGFGIGVAGAIGGTLADIFGFNAVFIIAGVIGIISAVVSVFLYRYLQKAHEHLR